MRTSNRISARVISITLFIVTFLAGGVHSAPIVVDFEQFTGMFPFGPGEPIPAAARLHDQLLSTYGVLFESGGPYVAVLYYWRCTPSGVNSIAGSKPDGTVTLATANYPITISFFDPANAFIPATTDFVSVKPDTCPTSGQNITLKAFDINGSLIAQDTKVDSYAALQVSAPGIHSVKFFGTVTEDNGVSIDDLTFNPVVPISPGTTLSADDFEDGAINTSLWTVGGGARGWRADDPIGSGNWQHKHQEVIDPSDGYLQAKVWGPTSANSYGAEVWIQTVHNFNDVRSYTINFTWEPEFLDYHANYYYIQITDGYIPPLADIHWPERRPPLPPVTEADLSGTNDLLWETRGGQYSRGWAAPSLGKVNWSITIDPAGIAKLYDAPGGTGSLLNEVSLDNGKPWYIRFLLSDGTSAGFPAGDARLNLYDFSASYEPSAGQPTYFADTGHYYELVLVPGGINWVDAKSAAQSRTYLGNQGYLATITSQQENDFITTALMSGKIATAWVGGYQPAGSPEPAGNWHWVTGEPWVYSNWRDLEPNNDGDENAVHVYASDTWCPKQWNDLEDTIAPLYGYVVEYGGEVPPPEPLGPISFTPPYKDAEKYHTYDEDKSLFGWTLGRSDSSIDLDSGFIYHDTLAYSNAASLEAHIAVDVWDAMSCEFSVPQSGEYSITFQGRVCGNYWNVSPAVLGASGGGLVLELMSSVAGVTAIPQGFPGDKKVLYETDFSLASLVHEITLEEFLTFIDLIMEGMPVGTVMSLLIEAGKTVEAEKSWDPSNDTFTMTSCGYLEAGETYRWTFFVGSRTVSASAFAALNVSGLDLVVCLDEVEISPNEGATTPAVEIRVESPVDLHVYDDQARHVGLNYATGQVELDIPGSSYTGPGTHPQVVRIESPTPGVYSVQLVGTGTGPYTLTVTGYVGTTVTSSTQFTGSISPGQIHQMAATVSGTADAIMIDVSAAPKAEAGGPYKGIVGQPITFDGSGSDDPDGEIHWYCWIWGPDGKGDACAEPVCQHTWYSRFSGNVTLAVIDDEGLYGSDMARVEVTGPERTMSMELASCADLHIYDPQEGHLGINYETNTIEQNIPGASFKILDEDGNEVPYDGGTPDEGLRQVVNLPVLSVGSYRIVLIGTSDGPFHLTINGLQDGEILCCKTDEGQIRNGECMTTNAVADIADSTLTLEFEPLTCLPALGVEPGEVTVNAQSSSVQEIIFVVYEMTGKAALHSVSIHCTDLVGKELAIKGSDVTFDLNNFDVAPGGEQVVHAFIPVPGGFREKVTGEIVVQSADGGTESIAVTVKPARRYPIVVDPGGPYEGVVGQPIRFDASGSYNPNGEIVWYGWDFDSSGKYYGSRQPVCEHTWDAPFSGTVKVLVMDEEGRGSTAPTTVVVNPAP